MKKRILSLALSFSLLLAASPMIGAVSAAPSNPAPTVIPALREWNGTEGSFEKTEGMRVVLGANTTLSDGRKEIISDYFKQLFDLEVPVVSGTASKGDILLQKEANAKLGAEGYTLQIRTDGVTVTAPEEIGLLYGVISILQSLQSDGAVPCGSATDVPAYGSRGGMLDVARLYFPLSYVEEITKYMAWFKLNEMHLHINEHGAFRLESDVPGLTAKDHYTKDEYRAYQKRMLEYGVEVITEIDSPAHAGCFKKVVPANYMLPDGYHVNIENPDAVQFILDLFDEYITGDDPVFVSKRVHVGTDEYPAGHNEAMRAYTDTLLKHISSRGYIPRFWGSFGGNEGFNGATPVTGEAEANFWANGLSDPQTLLSMGYDIINTHNTTLYIVPGGNYGFSDYYNLTRLYKNWQVYYLGYDSSSAIDPNHKQLLGANFALWNDQALYNAGYSDADCFDRLRGAVCLISEKTWCGQDTEKMDADEFIARYETLSLYAGDADPGRHRYDILEGEIPGGVKGFGWPYTASFDITWSKDGKEQILLSGEDGTLYVSAAGKVGFRRGVNDYTFGCLLVDGVKTSLKLIADNLTTILVYDGELYYIASKPAVTKDGYPTSSTFSLPLEQVSASVKNFKVVSGAEDYTEQFANRNLALNKPVEISESEVDYALFPSYAVDGNDTDPARRATFSRKDEQWLLVDLQDTYTIRRVEISFFEHVSDYGVSVSTDGVNFTEVVRVKDASAEGQKKVDVLEITPVEARYVRYEQHKMWKHASWGSYSGGIWEFRVFAFSEKEYTDLLDQADALLKTVKSKKLTAARDALKKYLESDTVFTTNLEALATVLKEAIQNPADPSDPPSTKVIPGDLTGDGILDPVDYLTLKKYMLETLTYELSPEQLIAADFNCDGEIETVDYIALKKAILSDE